MEGGKGVVNLCIKTYGDNSSVKRLRVTIIKVFVSSIILSSCNGNVVAIGLKTEIMYNDVF